METSYHDTELFSPSVFNQDSESNEVWRAPTRPSRVPAATRKHEELTKQDEMHCIVAVCRSYKNKR